MLLGSIYAHVSALQGCKGDLGDEDEWLGSFSQSQSLRKSLVDEPRRRPNSMDSARSVAMMRMAAKEALISADSNQVDCRGS